MEDPKWLRLITIGLVGTALVVGYFLLSGRMISNKSVKVPSQTTNQVSETSGSATPSASVLGQNAQTGVSSSPGSTPRATPLSAYETIAGRSQSQSQGQTQVLPRTGFPLWLIGIFSIGVLISGWGLRKFPH